MDGSASTKLDAGPTKGEESGKRAKDGRKGNYDAAHCRYWKFLSVTPALLADSGVRRKKSLTRSKRAAGLGGGEKMKNIRAEFLRVALVLV